MAASGEVSYNDNVERLLVTFDLLRTQRANVAILSGGRGWTDDPIVEAHVLADQLAAWGIERGRLIVEERARNTRENATLVAEITRARGYRKMLMITSAFHVPRALACFRAVGLAVDVYPVDYREYAGHGIGALIPRAEMLAASDKALREAAGRLVYRVMGYGVP
jgi:uncharacterized SAM-binding protein YcdF (DUF218 family)